MKKVCGTCGHWTGAGKLSGDCACEKFVYEPGRFCSAPDELQYWDFEGYQAGFETGPLFGCIHWINREEP